MTRLGCTWIVRTPYGTFAEAIVGRRWAYGRTRDDAAANAALSYIGSATKGRWGRC